MLEFALLGLLKERPMHGYDLRKRLREEFGPLSNLSYGSLYPALARLEADGAIQAVDGAQGAPARREAVPFTGSLGGERAATVARRASQVAAMALSNRGTRGRKVYEITPRGEALFEELLEVDGTEDDPRNFTLHLAFARHLTPQARVRLLERRRGELAGRLERAARAVRQPPRELDRFERAIAEHAERTVADELAWVQSLLDTELQLHQSASSQEPPVPTEAGPDPAVTTQTAPVTAGAGLHDGRSH